MQAKILKLQNQFEDNTQDQNRKGIFNGIAIFVNGYTGIYSLIRNDLLSFKA